MPNLNLIDSPDARFVVRDPKGSTSYKFRGNKVNLKDVDEAVALRIAADPGCKFLTLANAPVAANGGQAKDKAPTAGK